MNTANRRLCRLCCAVLAVAVPVLFALPEEVPSAPPRSRVPARGTSPLSPAPRLLLQPDDLARAAAQAPAPVAALYRALSRADPKASPPYEETALRKIDAFLAAPPQDLPPAERLEAAERALAVVLRYHRSMRPRPLGALAPSANLEARLRERLLDVRVRHLHAVTADARREGEWNAAVAAADRLLAIYPNHRAVLAEAARTRTGYAGLRLLSGDYRAAREQIEWIDDHLLTEPRFADPPTVNWLIHPGATAIRAVLTRRAEALRRAARGLPDREAVARLREALTAWPRLPGLYDDYLRRQHAYSVLYVGVRALPEFLSPGAARTDAERQAVALLFEGLVRESYDAAGEHYRPQLAADLPAVVPGGRRVYLDRHARWSNGERVTSADVRDTVLLLSRQAGAAQTWTDLVQPPVLEGDPFRLDFRFRQDALDPLAPLTFAVLPRTFSGSLQSPADPAFARQPVGSGPYQYAGRRLDPDTGRDCAVFTANPHYRRGGRIDRPYIREIRFYVPADPLRDLRDPKRPLHLLLDLPTAGVRALEQARVGEVRTLRNRRVWFLAINHAVPALADQDVRRAFAHALDRDRILTYRFRGGEPAHRLLGVTGSVTALATLDLRHDVRPEFHRRVNGPFPAGSWAVCPPPRVPAALFDLDRARTFADRAKAKVPSVKLTLKYPAGDSATADACRDMARQLGEVGAGAGWAVHIEPVAVPERELADALGRRAYELAYWHHDHASEAYWLWPLFDARPEALGPGGANYLGYRDAALESLFRTMMGQQHFAEVRRLTHEIHAHLYERMPLIPLWQLDTHVAVHPKLRPAHLDPLRIFDRVEEWRLEP